MANKLKVINLQLLLTIFIIVSLSNACNSLNNSESPSNSTCGKKVPPEQSLPILDNITFTLPKSWIEIHPHQEFASETLTSILNIFLFEGHYASPQACVEQMIKVVSLQSPVENYTIDTKINIAGYQGTIAVVEGFGDRTKNNVFRGIYAGFSDGVWIYIFAWDAFGAQAVSTISDEATIVLKSIKFKRLYY